LQQNDNNENFNSRNGLMNLENPHVIRRTNFQQKFSINIWAGIVNGMLIGPCVLPNRVNGLDYLNFLQNYLPGLLEDVQLRPLKTQTL
jgi:hypothetical protein